MPGGGTVGGKVTYVGTPAKSKAIDMAKEPACAKLHATPPTTESVVTGPDNALGNVVVYISAGAPDEAAPSQTVKVEQKGCQYVPHTLTVQVNQTQTVIIAFKVKNYRQAEYHVWRARSRKTIAGSARFTVV